MEIRRLLCTSNRQIQKDSTRSYTECCQHTINYMAPDRAL